VTGFPLCRYSKHANSDARVGKPAKEEVVATLSTYRTSPYGVWHNQALAAYELVVAAGGDPDSEATRDLMVGCMPASIKALYNVCHPPE